MAVVSCVGDYMFTVDSQCGSVDVIFTDNETDSVRRRRVLHRRQLNDDKLRTAAVTDKDHPVPIPASCNEPADSSSTAHTAAPCASTTSATVHTCIAGSASTHTAAPCASTTSATVHTCIAGSASTHTAAPCASTTSATVHTCIAGSASTHTAAPYASTTSATDHTCIAGSASTHTAAPCASTTSATVHTCIAGSASTHTTAELSWTLSDAVSMTRPLDTDIVSSDNDNLSDEDTDILSAAYTKDAFHKYLIAG